MNGCGFYMRKFNDLGNKIDYLSKTGYVDEFGAFMIRIPLKTVLTCAYTKSKTAISSINYCVMS